VYEHQLRQAGSEGAQAVQHGWKLVPKTLRSQPRLIGVYIQQLLLTGEEAEATSVLTSFLKKDWSDDIVALLGHFRGEETGVGVRQLVNLAVHGGQHIGMGMPEARHGSTTGGIQIALALRVKQKDTVTFGRRGRHLLQLTVHHSGGGGGHAGFRVEEMSGLWAVGSG
jgi:hypothetical protein